MKKVILALVISSMTFAFTNLQAADCTKECTQSSSCVKEKKECDKDTKKSCCPKEKKSCCSKG